MRVSPTFILAAVLATCSIAHGKKHPFSVDDLLAMERISDAKLSPDGKLIAYTLRTTDLAENKGRTDVWIVGTDGSAPRKLTDHPEKDGSPAFSPDGRAVYFLSTRSGSSQVWSVAIGGGEQQQVTQVPLDVAGFQVVDAQRLVLAIDVFPGAATLDDTAHRDQARKDGKVKALAYDELLYRHWDQWEDGKRAHLFLWHVGTTTDLMKGMAMDAPTLPFGDAGELAVSRDRTTLVFCAKDDGPKSAWSTNEDLWSVPLDGSRKPTRLTAGNPAWDGAPVFSPDGKTLAYLAMDRPGYESDRRHIVLMDWPSKKTRALAGAWDRSPGELVFAADGRALYATADHVGNHALFRVDLATGEPKLVADSGMYGDTLSLPDGSVAYTRNTLATPSELHILRGKQETQMTHHNDARVQAIEWGAWEQFTFKGAHGDDVHGYVVKPAGYTTGKVPVAFLVHGGPQGSFGNDFHYRWNPQAYAGHGYAAVMIDFHGSTGYGQAFTDAIRGDWGGAPFEDLMKGLDAAVAKYPFLDDKRVVALGASYGGYMINWLEGHTARFRALVCHDGLFDVTSAYYQTEELWFPEWEFMGTPSENPATYDRWNPMLFVKSWKTPMLVIHGGQDFRVTEAQGMGSFTALQRQRVESRMLYFPEENHWILRPQNTKRWHEEVLRWLDAHTKK